ncbi:MAG: hypothetical protein JSW06_11655 [Thermoplasmatales archaeon]|nr:MAG: hypothetical protein JSW06_11655 [Thermoplasmatales archaeon]
MDTSVEPIFVELEQTEMTGELSKETQSPGIPTESELMEKDRIQKRKNKNVEFISRLNHVES